MNPPDHDHPSVNHLIELYDTQVTTWLRLRAPHIGVEGPWLAKLIAPVSPGGDILDLGCGTGVPIAQYFIQRGFNLVGVDGAPRMIAQCRQRFPEQQWIVAKMQTLLLERRFDAILAWDSFFHLARHDQRVMFAVFARHARTGSRLLFNTGYSNGEAIGCFAGQDLYHASLDEQTYQTLLTDNGYRLVERFMPEAQSGQRAIWLAEKTA